jgi:5,5'-dehydrodivanillate O-demethylase
LIDVARNSQAAAANLTVRTDRGTPAGRYLRQFWQPVYHSIDLAAGRAVPLRIMNEELALFRGASGAAFIVEGRCPHRKTLLSNGWVQGDDLRCFYHGWKFAGDGRCLEQPAEDSSFCDKVALRAYPLREYLGLIFAYLGDGAPPEFPLYSEFERFAGLLEIDSYSRDCNYFQNVENALDMSHVGFTHGDNRVAFDGIGRGRDLRAEETDWGVAYTFTRADGKRRVQQFGMPNVFHMTALPNDPDIGWQESLFWWVPIEDECHMQFSLHRVPATGDAARRVHERRQARRSQIDLAHQDICERILGAETTLGEIDPARVDLVRLQDDLAQVGQGRIVERAGEHLGSADVGIGVIRRLWHREIAAQEDGRALKRWRRSDSTRVEAWGIDGTLSRDSISGAGEATLPELVDVRPYVEIAVQLKALHGMRRR